MLAFDTLKLARKLEAAGFEHKQAADIAEALAEARAVAELATKADGAAAHGRKPKPTSSVWKQPPRPILLPCAPR